MEPHPPPTIAVLYPGELGSSLAALLQQRGARVVTTLTGRGERTRSRARDANLIVLDSLTEVARLADIVISLVPPAEAEGMAVKYCAVAAVSPPSALYVDANSIGPQSARSIALRLHAAGRGFVDAAINGLARNLATGGTLFLSGERAEELSRYAKNGPLFDPDIESSARIVTDSLYAAARRRTRLRALVIPPETLRVWRAAVGNAVAVTFEIIDKLSARVTSVFVRRTA